MTKEIEKEIKPTVKSKETSASKTSASKTSASKTSASKTSASKTGASKTSASKTSASKTSASKTKVPIEAKVKLEDTPKKTATKSRLTKGETNTGSTTKTKVAKTKKTSRKFAESELEMIIEKMQDMKAHDLVCMDLREVMGASFEYFIIAHAPSSTQVMAIADGVEEVLRENLSLRAWHTEGYQNAEWILLDYGSIIVHVFQESVRAHYRLEDLWGDAIITHYDDVN
ncbi:MAG: ribosome silencing factor [Bacteroidales bacterium]